MINGINLTTYVSSAKEITAMSASRGNVYFSNITNITVQNVKVDSLFVSNDDANFGTSESGQGFIHPYDGVHNTDWSQSTVFAASFKLAKDSDSQEWHPGLNFGNLDTSAEVCSKVLVKKRIKTDSNSDWVTIYEQSVVEQEDFEFKFIDYTNPGNSEIEYAYIPVIKGVERIATSNTVKSEFDGWFICEPNAAYLIFLDGSNSYEFNQQGALIVALDRQFPFTVHNGKAKYFSGTLKGIFYDRQQNAVWLDEDKTIPLYDYNPDDYYIDEINGEEKRRANFKGLQAVDDVYNDEFGYLFRREVDNFLTDGKPKILKDYEGKIWLIDIIGNISVDTSKRLASPVHTIPWVEIANAKSGADLYTNGFSNTDYDKL